MNQDQVITVGFIPLKTGTGQPDSAAYFAEVRYSYRVQGITYQGHLGKRFLMKGRADRWVSGHPRQDLCVRHKHSMQQVALVLPLFILIFGSAERTSAQSVWQKMKQNVLQQQCQQGLQKACQALAKMTQNQGQRPQQAQPPSQSGQPTLPTPGTGTQEGSRGEDGAGASRPPHGT